MIISGFVNYMRQKTIYIARQPEHLRKTHFGSTYLSKEIISVKTETQEYPSLSSEKYCQKET